MQGSNAGFLVFLALPFSLQESIFMLPVVRIFLNYLNYVCILVQLVESLLLELMLNNTSVSLIYIWSICYSALS